MFVIPENNVEVSDKDHTHKVVTLIGQWACKGTKEECEEYLEQAKARDEPIFKDADKWKIELNK